MQRLLKITLLLNQLLTTLCDALGQLIGGILWLFRHLALLFTQTFQCTLAAGGRLCRRLRFSRFLHLLQRTLHLLVTGLAIARLSALLLGILRLLHLLARVHLLLQLRKFARQLLLLTSQPFKLPAPLLFFHVLHTPRQIALRARQTFLAAGKLFKAAGFLGVLLLTATRLAWRFIAVLVLPHLHVKQLAQIFALLLSTATAATAGLPLEVNVCAVDLGFSTQHHL